MILILDGHNLLHRARSGFTLGEYAVAFNFFRQLRALVDQFKPNRVLFTLEGTPKRQLALLPDYKANRTIDTSTEEGIAKQRKLDDFQRQKSAIVDLLSKHFPVSVVQHPDFEADDVVHNLIKQSSSAVDFTVVSTDTDFIQLLQTFKNVRLYNPVKKEYVEAPKHYSYVVWKALRGDVSDNITGLVTEVQADKMVNHMDGERLDCWLRDSEHPERYDLFTRNEDAIKFKSWTDEEALQMRSSGPSRDWEKIRKAFDVWGFKSILKDGTWAKFTGTFDTLWNLE